MIKRIIDIHHHIENTDTKKYVKETVAAAARFNIKKIVFLGIEWENSSLPGNNKQVLEAYKMEPDLIVPFAGINMDLPSDFSLVKKFKEEGFIGLKFIRPQYPYHDERLYPWYEQAAKFKMPCLFHLGIVARLPEWEGKRTDNNLMRPVYLDTIARSFPDLDIIGAHMGNPWFEEAAMSCRWNPNLYFDMSGSTLKRKKPSEIGELLWWGNNTYPAYKDKFGRSAWQKICFGSDVNIHDFENVLNDYENLANTLKLNDFLVDSLFYANAASILQKAGVKL